MKIGITGSISSGKSTVTSILSKNKKLIFSADKIVQKLYLSNKFRKKMSKKFKLKNKNVKTEILKKLLNEEISLKSLGKFIHPFVRKKMKEFSRKNRKKEIIFIITFQPS